MSTMSSTAAPSTRPSASAGLIRWLQARASHFADHWARREAIKELQRLDDRELRDIGILRSQIEPAVRGVVDPEFGKT